MFSKSQAAGLFLLCVPTLVVSQSILGLVDTLIASGASNFASFIQSDPDVFQLYSSGEFQTVFAPSDCTCDSILQGRAPGDREQATYQVARSEADLARLSSPFPIAFLETANQSPQLDNRGQRIVVDNRPANVTTFAKRWNPQFKLPQSLNKKTKPLLEITSGLGNTTNVIRGDIPFSGGIIHITDGHVMSFHCMSQTNKYTDTCHSTATSLYRRLLAVHLRKPGRLLSPAY